MDGRPGAGSPGPALVGRRHDIELIDNLLLRARHRGEALVITGERGSGRSGLLDAASQTADHAGFLLLRLDGRVVQEQHVSGLDVVMDELGAVTTRPRPSSDLLLAGNELLRLLGEGSLDRPLMLAVDDLDVLDRHSASVLGFAARRLASSRVALLMTTEPSEGADGLHGDLPLHRLAGLSPADSLALLTTRFPGLAPAVTDRVVADAQGSPLALLELPTALSDRQRRGADPLPPVLPMTDRLRQVHSIALDRLSTHVREVLLLAAVSGPGDLEGLLVAEEDALDIAALEEAEREGLIELRDRGRRLTFRRPLTRNAVLDHADDEQLRRARDRVAGALVDLDRRAWYLSEGVDHPDEGISDGLAHTADRAADRGDAEGAAAAMVRSAELSPVPSIRSERLLAAAHLNASVTGELSAAERLLADASQAHPAAAITVRAAATSAQLRLAEGAHLDDVQRLLVDATTAAARSGETAGRETVDAFQLLFYVSLMAARQDSWTVFELQIERLQPSLGPTFELLTSILPDLTRAGPETVTALEAALARLPSSDVAEVIGVSIAAFHLDRLADCRAALSRIVDQARVGRSVSTGAEAMLRLSLDDCATGQLDSATRLAEEGLRWCREIGQKERAWTFELCLALVAALRGDATSVRVLTGRMTAWASPRGAALVEHHCAYVRGLAALGRGDFEEAYAQATAISPAGTLSPYTTQAVWACLDLVEAAVHTGRSDAAVAHATTMARSGMARLSPRLSLRVAAASAMVAPAAEARDGFQQALATSDVDRWPFELARVQLAYGERLRRMRALVDAQPQLVAAYETFRRLGMRPWATRTAQEMRAAGMPMPAGERPAAAALSARDREIAMLAASGLSNQQIGERLFLSPRTVGARLYRIFPELGVSSRAALRDALDGLSEGQP